MRGHVFLVGMPGSGKTSVGEALAGLLGRPFVDLDSEVERKAGTPIQEIFRVGGESRFREVEAEVLAEASASGVPAVIACGGGTVLDEENRERMQSSGTVVTLTVPRSVLAARVWRKPRPLLRGPVDLDRLDRERKRIYQRVADHVVRADGDVQAVARRIAEALE